MKLQKLFTFLLMIIILSTTVMAYGVNIVWTLDKSGFDAELYRCTSSSCASMDQTLQSTTSSDNKHTTAYTTTGTKYHAAYFYKPGYRPLGYIVKSTGPFTTTFSDNFEKKNYCESPISSFTASNYNPTKGQTITISANVKSAFTDSDDAPGSPDYEPTSHSSYFTSDITVNLQVLDGSSVVKTLTPKIKQIYQDQTKGVTFSLDTSSLSPGTYTVKMTTNPTDSICNQGNKQLKSKTFTITVKACNRPPVLSIPDKTVYEDSGLNNNLVDLWLYAYDSKTSDVDLDFTIVSESATNIIDCTLDNDRYLDCTTKADKNGYSDVKIRVSDGSLTDEDTFRITVTPVNDAPTLSIPDKTVYEDSGMHNNLVDLWAYAYDKETSDASLDFTIISQSADEIVECFLDSDRYLDCTTKAGKTGSSYITIKVSDGSLTYNDMFKITVTPVNDAPVITNIPGQTIIYGENFVDIELDDYVSDPDNTDAQMTWTVSGEDDITVTILTGRIARITYPNAWTGADTVTFKAKDPSGLYDTDSATFHVLETTECSDDKDNDDDGKIDMADPGCDSPEDDDETDPYVPQCRDGIDNDEDGWTDYPNDPGCSSSEDDDESNNPECSDGIDNDEDSWIDFPFDPGCDSYWDDDETDPYVPECRDGIDNDEDGWADYPDDPGCSSPDDDSESPNPQCSDGIDNDEDGNIDMDDEGCDDKYDDDESDEYVPQCRDGIDNDGDGWADYPDDPGCSSPDDDSESPNPQCSDGIDNDEDGDIDMDDAGCDDKYDDDESDDPYVPQCSDEIDNDEDGKIDMDDPGCDNPEDDDESDEYVPECSDGVDNDEDGDIDMDDPGCDNPEDDDESDEEEEDDHDPKTRVKGVTVYEPVKAGEYLLINIQTSGPAKKVKTLITIDELNILELYSKERIEVLIPETTEPGTYEIMIEVDTEHQDKKFYREFQVIAAEITENDRKEDSEAEETTKLTGDTVKITKTQKPASFGSTSLLLGSIVALSVILVVIISLMAAKILQQKGKL